MNVRWRERKLFITKLEKIHELKTNVIEQNLSGENNHAEERETELIMLNDLNNLSIKYKQRKRRNKKKKTSED